MQKADKMLWVLLSGIILKVSDHGKACLDRNSDGSDFSSIILFNSEQQAVAEILVSIR